MAIRTEKLITLLSLLAIINTIWECVASFKSQANLLLIQMNTNLMSFHNECHQRGNWHNLPVHIYGVNQPLWARK